MLYEVITKDVMHLGACVAQSESVEYLSIANNKDVTDFAIRPFRITSYNVCYTKLLRCYAV